MELNKDTTELEDKTGSAASSQQAAAGEQNNARTDVGEAEVASQGIRHQRFARRATAAEASYLLGARRRLS